MKDYNPDEHIILRDWCRERDISIDRALSRIDRALLRLPRVNNPHKQGLWDAEESYNPTSRVVLKKDWFILDEIFAELGAPKNYNIDLQVEWKKNEGEFESIRGYKYDVDYTYGSVKGSALTRLPDYIFRPPVLDMRGLTTASTEGFNWLPYVTLTAQSNDLFQLKVYAHRRANLDTGLLTLNAASFSVSLIEGTLSDVPGTALNTGIYEAFLTKSKMKEIVENYIEHDPKPKPKPVHKPLPAPKPEDDFVDYNNSLVTDVKDYEDIIDITADWSKIGKNFYKGTILSGNEDNSLYRFPKQRYLLTFAQHKNRIKAFGSLLDVKEVKINGVYIDFKKKGYAPSNKGTRYEAILTEEQADGILNPTLISLSDRVLSESKGVKRLDISNAFRVSGNTAKLTFFDTTYWLAEEPLWDEIIAKSSVDKGVYVNERYDCDDFMLAFKSECSRSYGLNSVGAALSISGEHAFCAIPYLSLNGDILFKFLEPQSDKWVVTDDPKYNLDKGFVIF